MSFPSGYKRLEYIQSSGTQYIDTLFTPNQDTRLTSKLLCTPNTKTVYVLGARTSPTSNAYCFICSLSGYYAIQFGTAQTNINPSYNSTSPIEIDFRKSSISINGVVAATPTSSTFTAPCNLTLFGINTKGSVTCATIDVRFYDCKIYDNGTLIRDYIPCQTASGEIGLWDDVNSVFYGNSGTGVFTAGPVVDVIQDAPPNLQQTMSIRLIWSEVSGAERYNVYRDDTLLGTTTGPFYVDYTAAENTEYTYAVSAVNSAGESPKTTITVYTKTGYFLYKPLIQSATFQ